MTAQPTQGPSGGGAERPGFDGVGVEGAGGAGVRVGEGAGGVGVGEAVGVGAGVTVTICPDGPLLLRGPAELRTVDGSSVTHDRTVLALCRCGRSRLRPLCDGSHRLSRFRDPASAAQLDHVLTHATPYEDREGEAPGAA